MLTLATNYDGMASAVGVMLAGVNACLFALVYFASRSGRGRRFGWAAWLVVASMGLFVAGGWLFGMADDVRVSLFALVLGSSAALSAAVWFDSRSGLAVAMPLAGAAVASAVMAASLGGSSGPLGILAAMAVWHGAAIVGVRAGAVPKWDLERAFENRCARCGYDLAGLRGGGCPECGTPGLTRGADPGSEP